MQCVVVGHPADETALGRQWNSGIALNAQMPVGSLVVVCEQCVDQTKELHYSFVLSQILMTFGVCVFRSIPHGAEHGTWDCVPFSRKGYSLPSEPNMDSFLGLCLVIITVSIGEKEAIFTTCQKCTYVSHYEGLSNFSFFPPRGKNCLTSPVCAS